MLSDFQVTTQDVLDKLPIIGDQVSATTAPLSTGDVDDAIQDGESRFAELLRRQGKDPGTLTDDQKRQIQTAVEAYAVAECMDIIGAVGARYDQYRNKAEEIFDRFNQDDSQVANNAKSKVITNIDDSTTTGFNVQDPGYEY